MTQAQTLASARFAPTTGNMGRVVTGIDLNDPMSNELVAEIKEQLANHGVLVIRNQDISEEKQIEFTQHFGDTIGHPVPGIGGGDKDEEYQGEVFYLINDPDKNQQARENPKRKDGTLGWHSDLEYMPEPQVYSVLCAVEIPDAGGETEWCNLADAYDALDDTTKAEIAEIQVVRWYVRQIPEVTHPAVRRHPVSGRRCIYVSPGLSRYVVGMAKDQSDKLLKKLCDHATQERFCYVHSWKQGDVVMWDNRLTLHQRHGFDMDKRRVVRRTQTAGEPVLA